MTIIIVCILITILSDPHLIIYSRTYIIYKSTGARFFLSVHLNALMSHHGIRTHYLYHLLHIYCSERQLTCNGWSNRNLQTQQKITALYKKNYNSRLPVIQFENYQCRKLMLIYYIIWLNAF